MALQAKVWKKKLNPPAGGYLGESVLEEVTIFLLGKKVWREEVNFEKLLEWGKEY